MSGHELIKPFQLSADRRELKATLKDCKATLREKWGRLPRPGYEMLAGEALRLEYWRWHDLGPRELRLMHVRAWLVNEAGSFRVRLQYSEPLPGDLDRLPRLPDEVLT